MFVTPTILHLRTKFYYITISNYCFENKLEARTIFNHSYYYVGVVC